MVPDRQHASRMRSHSVVVAVCLDEHTQRVMASSRLGQFLEPPADPPAPGAPVELMVYRQTELGAQVIVDDRHAGLVYASETFAPLAVGDRVTGYVRRLRDDGKLDISQRAPGAAGRDEDTRALLRALEASGGRLPLHDDSTPDEISALVLAASVAHAMPGGTYPKIVDLALKKLAFDLPELPDTPTEFPRLQALATGAEYRLQVIYMIPGNRTPQPGAEQTLQDFVIRMQAWFRDHTERIGYAPKTFAYETEDGSTPTIHVAYVEQPDYYFHDDYVQRWSKVLNRLTAAGFPIWHDGTLTLVLVVASMAFAVDARLAVVALLPFPAMALAFWWISRHVHDASRDALARFSDLNDHVQETLSGVRTLRALGLEARSTQRFAELAAGAAQASERAQRWEATYEPAVGLSLTAASVTPWYAV